MCLLLYVLKMRVLVCVYTVVGFLGDTQFCGSNSSVDGMEEDRSKCPGYEQTDSCPWSAEASFWAEASQFVTQLRHFFIYIFFDALNMLCK